MRRFKPMVLRVRHAGDGWADETDENAHGIQEFTLRHLSVRGPTDDSVAQGRMGTEAHEAQDPLVELRPATDRDEG